MSLTADQLRSLVTLLAPVLRQRGERDHYLDLAFHGDRIFDGISPDADTPEQYARALLSALDGDLYRRTADGRDSLTVYLNVVAGKWGGELAVQSALVIQARGSDQRVSPAPDEGVPPAASYTPAPRFVNPSAAGQLPVSSPKPRTRKARQYVGENNSWIDRNSDVRMRNLILFVHGYTGGPDRTWEKFPDLLMRTDQGFYDEYEVGSFGYDTNLVRNKESLPTLTGQLAAFLQAHAAPADGVENVFLITHSLGGIVARAYMLDICRRPLRAALYAQLKQIHFVASPQEGAPLPAFLARFIKPFNSLAWDLRKKSPVMAGLLDEWLKFAEGARADGEHVPELYHYLGSQDWVASYKDYSNGRLGKAEEVMLVSSDHTTLVKPESTGKTLYALITQRIRDYAARHPAVDAVHSANDRAKSLSSSSEPGSSD